MHVLARTCAVVDWQLLDLLWPDVRPSACANGPAHILQMFWVCLARMIMPNLQVGTVQPLQLLQPVQVSTHTFFCLTCSCTCHQISHSIVVLLCLIGREEWCSSLWNASPDTVTSPNIYYHMTLLLLTADDEDYHYGHGHFHGDDDSSSAAATAAASDSGEYLPAVMHSLWMVPLKTFVVYNAAMLHLISGWKAQSFDWFAD